MTHEQITANINIMHEYLKASGLAQPQHVRDSLDLLEHFQRAHGSAPIVYASATDRAGCVGGGAYILIIEYTNQ